jgi:tripartite-type tricarboxylate transporter receptor subunit TctC
MMKRYRFLSTAVALAACAYTSLAGAQATDTVKILVGFPAGGAPDAVARAYADQLRVATGATVVVENRAGASGKIAIDALLAGAADGQTLALIPSSVLALVPMVVKAAKYDALRDFVTIGSVAEYGFGIAASQTTGIGDFAALKPWLQGKGKAATYATPGLGTPQHFLGAQTAKALGSDLTHVPYRGGAAALTDVIGGQVPFLITTEQLLVPYEGQGKLKPLFITSRERNPRMPNVPTAREIGLSQLESTDWFGVFAKAGTPAAKVDELRGQLAKVVASITYRDAMKGMGYTVPLKQSSNFTQVLQTERAAWADRVKISGFEATD